MKNTIRVGVDLAKNVFHIHAVNESEDIIWQGKYNRTNWMKAIVKRVPTTAVIGMEAVALQIIGLESFIYLSSKACDIKLCPIVPTTHSK
ncbi:hypothetical protein [Shewanella sp. T24-MNA-CIBAN-0130]|uniref:hypothetical protein n=1 Tax=Shewanella sp. T24-MNA-CIBAN-0130 TaxID=3140470 RepID=UPI0033165747